MIAIRILYVLHYYPEHFTALANYTLSKIKTRLAERRVRYFTEAQGLTFPVGRSNTPFHLKLGARAAPARNADMYVGHSHL